MGLFRQWLGTVTLYHIFGNVHMASFPPIQPSATGKPTMGASCRSTSEPRRCDSQCPNGFVDGYVRLLTDPGAHYYSSQPMPECAEGGNSRINQYAHPPQYANDGNLTTYWQSPENSPAVNLSIDMLIEQEIQRIEVKFVGPPPKAMILYRSQDGVQWDPYQYFAADCQSKFNISTGAPNGIEEPACSETSVSDTSLQFEPLRYRTQGVAPYLENEALQRITRARYIRLGMLEAFIERDATDTFTGIVYPTYTFYMISELQITSRCSCNGHASSCDVDQLDGHSVCLCEHGTVGKNCEQCAPLENAKPWRRGISVLEPNECVECNCNNHALSCHYNNSLDRNPTSRAGVGGGVCDNCRDNTQGQQCDECVRFYYHPEGVPWTDPDACVPCACNEAGRLFLRELCNRTTGQCDCKANVDGRDCSICRDEYYGLEENNTNGCTACECDTTGTINGSRVCDKSTGQCPCDDAHAGRTCAECASDHFLDETGVCSPCNELCGTAGCSHTGIAGCNNCLHGSEFGVCVSECSPLHYPDPATGVCMQCHPACALNCTSGGNILGEDCFACLTLTHNGSCVSTCPIGTYPDQYNECQECDNECGGTGECFGPGPLNCLHCRGNELLDGSCVAACPAGTYEDNNTHVCQSCSHQCNDAYSCNGPNSHQCDRCEGFRLLPSTDPATQFTATCTLACPSYMHYEVSVNESESGRNADSICQQCHPECASSCNGSGPGDCIGECRNSLIILADGHYICTENCPFGETFTVNASGSRLCQPCNDLCNQTLGCSGPDVGDCNSCQRDTFNHLGHCVSTCPVGFFGDESSRQCELCHSACDGCTGPSEDDCLICNNYRNGNRCVDLCPLDMYTDWVNDSVPITPASLLECLDCHPECRQGCEGPANRQCTACNNVLHEGQCLEFCPTGFFRNVSMVECQPCDVQCARGCTGSGPAECGFDPERPDAACSNFRYGSTCVERCESHQYAVGQECFDCSTLCSPNHGCTGPSDSQCTVCRWMNDTTTGNCVHICPHGTYQFMGLECIECHSECSGCSGPSNQNCYECANVRTEDGCSASCPPFHYVDSQSRCGRCNSECLLGCRGPSASDCVLPDMADYGQGESGCATKRRENACVTQCDESLEWEQDGFCLPCSELCVGGCRNETSSDCLQCRHLSLDGMCVASCPNSHYLNGSTCQACSTLCSSAHVADEPICHGYGPQNCAACSQASRDGSCVESCNNHTEFTFIDPMSDAVQCIRCDTECADDAGCTGPGRQNCGRCKNWYNFDGTCVPSCDETTTFANNDERTCIPCNEQCTFNGGCPLGPQDDGCAVCASVRLANGSCTSTCGVGWYPDRSRGTDTAIGGICAPCHSSCNPDTGCTGGQPHHCGQCTAYIYLGQCISTCPTGTYVDESNTTCLTCDNNCDSGCTGARPDQCHTPAGFDSHLNPNAADYGCRSLVIMQQVMAFDVNPFRCVAQCPVGTYANDDDICEPCSPFCAQETGCSGPSSIVGDGGCTGCPTSQYLDNQSQSCQSCSPECDSLGCLGPQSRDCRSCRGFRGPDDACHPDCEDWRGTHFSAVTETGRACVTCHESCDGVSGCSGPTTSDCYVCSNYRTSDGHCVDNCQSGWIDRSSTTGELMCRNCHPSCDPQQGCRGPSRVDCDACRQWEAMNGTCLEGCPDGQIGQDNNQCTCNNGYYNGNACQSCHSLCGSQGCTGPAARDCTDCLVARNTITYACVASCPTNHEIAISSGDERVCTCSSNVYDNNGTCIICSDQCLEGCSGEGPSRCLGSPVGCRTAFFNGSCVDTCPVHHELDEFKRCICSGYLTATGDCYPCSPECRGGCSGPSPQQCSQCLHFRSGISCVSECRGNEIANSASICEPCHQLCAEGCSAPNNKSACAGSRRCADVLVDKSCSSKCTKDLMFAVDCSSVFETDAAVSEICLGYLDTVCVESCPQSLPYFNDTRLSGTNVPVSYQVCASSCNALGRFPDKSQFGETFRCIDAEIALQASTDSEDESFPMEVAIAIVVGVIVAIVVVAIAFTWKQKTSYDLNPSGNQPLRQTVSNPISG